MRLNNNLPVLACVDMYDRPINHRFSVSLAFHNERRVGSHLNHCRSPGEREAKDRAYQRPSDQYDQERGEASQATAQPPEVPLLHPIRRIRVTKGFPPIGNRIAIKILHMTPYMLLQKIISFVFI